jgi:hypothetical protein
MNLRDWRVIRVMLAVAAIFVLGVATGRLTAPPSVVATQRILPPPPPLQEKPSADVVLNHLRGYLRMSPEQEAEVKKLLDQWAAEAADAPPNSPKRRELFAKYNPLIRAKMKPEQLETYDGMVESGRRRARRAQRRP